MAKSEFEFRLLPREPFKFQGISSDAVRMRRLGMSLRAIGNALDVEEKTVRKALLDGGGKAALQNG